MSLRERRRLARRLALYVGRPAPRRWLQVEHLLAAEVVVAVWLLGAAAYVGRLTG